MNVAGLVPPVEQKAPFELYTLNRIVEVAGCYCLTNAGGDILYVGQAVGVRRRLIQHFDGEKRSKLTIHGRVSLVHWRVEVPTRLNALERGWLEAIRLVDGEYPPLNHVSAPT